MMKKVLSLLVLALVFVLGLPILTQAQSEQDLINQVLQQYLNVRNEHNNMVNEARDIVNSSEEDYLRQLIDQIDSAGQVVQDTQTGGIAIAINPPYPEPYEEVTASFIGYGVQLNESLISWFVDGERVRTGVGATSIRTTLDRAGESTVITATIEPANMESFTRSVIVVPNTLDLLWEPIDSYTPPFYRGKALPSHDSIVKITAVSNIYDGSDSRVDQNELVYSWMLNNRRRDLSEYSGYGGKTAYAFASFLNRGHLVSVEATNTTRGIDTRKSTLFSLRDPEIIFYRKEPLFGINYEVALGSETSVAQDGSARLVAAPFYFDIRNGFSDLQMNWKINNRDVLGTEEMRRGEIPLMTQGQGRSRLNLEIKTNKILQKANANINIHVN